MAERSIASSTRCTAASGRTERFRARSSTSGFRYGQRRHGKRARDGQVAHQAPVAGRRVPTPPYELLSKDHDFAEIGGRVGLPLMVKPRAKARASDEQVVSIEKVQAAYELAAEYDEVVIAERFIEGIEVTAAILGTKRCVDPPRDGRASSTNISEVFRRRHALHLS